MFVFFCLFFCFVLVVFLFSFLLACFTIILFYSVCEYTFGAVYVPSIYTHDR